MKSVRIVWTPFALGQLDEIFEYIANEAKSISPANKQVNRIFESTEQLIRFPKSGQKEPLLQKIGQDSRYVISGNYKIIYEYHRNENLVIITDVFHTKQNPEQLKKNSRK